MNIKRYTYIVLICLLCLISISAINATDNSTSDTISTNDNTGLVLEDIQEDDVSTTSNNNENDEQILEENNNNDDVLESGTDKPTLSEEPLTFTQLNQTINGNTNSTIYLSNNYTYNNATDSNFQEGIVINRNLTIYGNGFTLDGNHMARIFQVNTSNVKFYNINFIKGNPTRDGGAIYGTSSNIFNVYNCTFINNTAGKDDRSGNGGAINNGNATNCTFINNTAKRGYGGAIYNGNATNCNFTQNTANKYYGGAIAYGNATNCTFTQNSAHLGGAIHEGSAYNCNFTQNNATSGALSNGNAYNCTFTQNNANYGAISYGNAYNCTFTGNTAERGGAISMGNATNCNFTQNTATESGGAISSGNAYNCTFTQNTATESGGAIELGNAYNCTFTQNTATTYVGGAICAGNAYNCTFNQNNATNGGAISYGNAYNCTFTQNTATEYGGAIYQGNAEYSTFTGNTADYGGAMYESNAAICTFNNNNATIGGQAMYAGKATLCIFNGNTNQHTTITPAQINIINSNITHLSDEKLLFNVTAENVAYDGLNTTIKIYKGQELIETYYALTGEGCTINLNPGKYTATLTLTLIPEIEPVNTTLTINKAKLSFKNLNTTINGNENTTIYLVDDYIYNSSSDTNFKNNGIIINRPIIIYGNGITIDGNHQARIFTVNAENVKFYNINFINGKTEQDGGAISGKSTAINCNFTNNTAKYGGGAIYNGEAINCTFTDNNAIQGQAMNGGYAILCTFNGNTIEGTTIIPAEIIVSNYTSTYNSGKKLQFNLTINNTPYDGFNTTIKIYDGNQLIDTVYGLTGDGWVVDLNPGIYTAVLSLTDYPEEQSANATIIIKHDTTVTINPIVEAEIGKEITITYTTNSNATATIKINGNPITDEKYTPTKPGTYNLTIEIAESEYYTQGYNETTFTVEKIETKIVINPIINAEIEKEITITYTTNSNATATIKINGNPITDEKYTPTKPGTYNLTIEIAESEYYTQGYNETTFTVKPHTTTFTDLNKIINDNTNTTIYLTENYTFNSTTDTDFIEGIVINRTLEIFGNGITIDANHMARIFQVTAENVIFHDINFINGNTTGSGGAINGNCTAINCNFTNNHAEENGGAINNGTAINCTFNNNTATNGGAISNGEAINCTFNNNSATNGGALYNSNATNCTFINNTAENGGAMYGGNVYNSTFINNNATKGGATYQTNATNCNFTNNTATEGQAMYGGNSTMNNFDGNDNQGTTTIPVKLYVYNYTSTYKSGEKLLFNLIAGTTNILNGYIATINIYNGTQLVGTYYGYTGEGWVVSLDSGNYTAVLSIDSHPDVESATATITVSPLASKIYASAVTTTYNINKYLTITLKDSDNKAIPGAVITVNLGSAKKYTTDANGQVKINAATLIPKTYTAKITYAGDTNYNGSTASVKVTVKKAAQKITASAKTYKLKVKTKKYTITLKNNKNKVLKNTKVTLKVNGKTYRAKTNKKGKATFKITNLKKAKKYTATITSPANKYYNKATKKVKITVKR